MPATIFSAAFNGGTFGTIIAAGTYVPEIGTLAAPRTPSGGVNNAILDGSGSAVFNGDAGNGSISLIDTATVVGPNAEATAVLTLLSSYSPNSTPQFRFFCHRSDANGGYRVETIGNTLRVMREVPGAEFSLGTYDLTAGTYTIRARMQGNDITVYVDEVLRISVSNSFNASVSSAPFVLIYGGFASNNAPSLDSLVIVDLDASGSSGPSAGAKSRYRKDLLLMAD